MTASVNRPYIPAIDHIRGYAAMLVFFYHGLHLISGRLVRGTPLTDPTTQWMSTDNPLFAVLIEGHTGVALFIVLSGFILSTGSLGRTINYKNFLFARILRIYPLYIFLLVFAIRSDPNATLNTVIVSLLPLSDVPAAGAVNGPFGAMFWTIAIEFQCYLVFPFLIATINERGAAPLIGFIGLTTLFCIIAALVTDADVQATNYSSVCSRIGQFCIGILAAIYYMKRGEQRTWRPYVFVLVCVVVVMVLFGFHKAGGWPSKALWKTVWPAAEGSMWAFFILAYIPFAKQLPHLATWIARSIGEISYSIYLVHFAILLLIVRQGIFVQLTGNGYIDGMITTLLIALPATLLISALTYSIIELPFLRQRTKYV